MQNNLVEKFGFWSASARHFILGAVDRSRFDEAENWTDRAKAIDWLRLGAMATPIAMIALGVGLAIEMASHKAYPPPLPTVEELKTRHALIETSSPTPPSALAERNRPVGAAS